MLQKSRITSKLMKNLFPKILTDDFGTLCSFLYLYKAMHYIYCVKNRKLLTRCYTLVDINAYI